MNEFQNQLGELVRLLRFPDRPEFRAMLEFVLTGQTTETDPLAVEVVRVKQACMNSDRTPSLESRDPEMLIEAQAQAAQQSWMLSQKFVSDGVIQSINFADFLTQCFASQAIERHHSVDPHYDQVARLLRVLDEVVLIVSGIASRHDLSPELRASVEGHRISLQVHSMVTEALVMAKRQARRHPR